MEELLDQVEEAAPDPGWLATLQGLACVAGWRRRCVLHFSELPEEVKEDYRMSVRSKLALYRPRREGGG